jgi:hypothetical protein
MAAPLNGSEKQQAAAMREIWRRSSSLGVASMKAAERKYGGGLAKAKAASENNESCHQ